jgi:hypothetical protein
MLFNADKREIDFEKMRIGRSSRGSRMHRKCAKEVCERLTRRGFVIRGSAEVSRRVPRGRSDPFDYLSSDSSDEEEAK